MIKQTNYQIMNDIHNLDHLKYENIDSLDLVETNCCTNNTNLVYYLKTRLEDLKLQIVEYRSHFKKPCFNCSASFHVSSFEDSHFNFQKMFAVKQECLTCERNFTTVRSFYHKCNVCSASFNNCPLLLDHRRKEHNSEKPQQCAACNKSLPYKGLSFHIYGHKLLRKCPHCNKKCATKTRLKLHLLSHTTGKPFSCKYCNKLYKSKRGLDLHLFVHTGDKAFKCNFCDKTFATQHLRNQHKLIHVGGKQIHMKKSFQCKYCPKQYKSKYFLNIHLFEHTGGKKFKCDLCDNRFAKEYLLNRHKLNHTGNSFQHKSKVELDQHLLLDTDDGTFKCNFCYKTFDTQHLLNQHKVNHMEKPAQMAMSFQCKYCPKEFKSKWCLIIHLCEHTGGKTFKCDECDKTFAKGYMLNRHKHSHIENSFQCKYCPKQCKTKQNLDLHQFVHTGEKKFKCDECDKTFAKGYILNRHKLIHMENLFQCKYCSKQYRTKQGLDLHSFKHNGGKEWSATICKPNTPA